jgi:ATP-dependent helicase/nuclease subunit B
MTGRLAPNLFMVPAGEPFLSRLADAVTQGALPGCEDFRGARDFSRLTIYLPTRRAVREFSQELWQRFAPRTVLLPDIRPLGDVDEDAHDLLAAPDNRIGDEPAIDPLDRLFLLARLMRAWAHDHAPQKQHAADLMLTLDGDGARALAVAADLCVLLDGAETERVDLAGIAGLDVADFAANWQVTRDVLGLIVEDLPRQMAERGVTGPAARRNRLLERETGRLAADGTRDPVVAAGSTGSIPATASLLKVIAGLPNGCVIVPGLDRTLDDEAWAALPPAHPQFGLARLLAGMGADRNQVALLPGCAVDRASNARARLMSEVMRPADTTDTWSGHLAEFGEDELELALAGISAIEAPGPREEALAIALILREALEEPGRRATLVTPDRTLARRVAGELRRWRIDIDDTAGEPLAKSPPGVFALLLVDCLTVQLAPIPLMALLKHPFTRLGLERGQALARARLLELACLRGVRPAPGVEGLRAALAETRRVLAGGGRLPAALKRIDDTALEEVEDLIGRLERAVGPLLALIDGGMARTLPEIVHCHITALSALSAGPDDVESSGPSVWQDDDGDDLASLMQRLALSGEARDLVLPQTYPAVIDYLMSRAVTRPRRPGHPRLAIRGLLEARLLAADVVVLGGLNENTWPGPAVIDPWLNRPMRAELGLLPPERQIGLSAHDFVQLAMASRVHLVRAAKQDGAQTVAARWVLRLKTLIGGERAKRLEDAGARWLTLVDALDRGPSAPPQPPQPPQAPPAPSPPVASRPRRLSVTEIETWIRDPYALYARRILGLEELDRIDADPSAADRGLILHQIFHEFTARNKGVLGPEAADQLLEIGANIFERHIDRPGVRAFWWPRFERIARWFIGIEDMLREAVAEQLTETGGMLEFDAPGGTFKITARADRIDVMVSGLVRLIDYKSGQVPSIDQVKASFSPQLPLEAAIAQAGGFEGLGAVETGELIYIRTTGAETPGEVRLVSSAQLPAAAAAARALDGLKALVRQYDDPAQAYLPSVARDFETKPRTYDHLARYREWALNPAAGGRR